MWTLQSGVGSSHLAGNSNAKENKQLKVSWSGITEQYPVLKTTWLPDIIGCSLTYILFKTQMFNENRDTKYRKWTFISQRELSTLPCRLSAFMLRKVYPIVGHWWANYSGVGCGTVIFHHAKLISDTGILAQIRHFTE